MKKFIVLSLAVGIFVSFGSAAFAQSPSVFLEIEKTVSTGFDTSNYVLDVGPSSTFYISIYVKNILKFVSYNVDMIYDRTKIPVPLSSKFQDFAVGAPLGFEQSPIIGATKFLTSSGDVTTTKIMLAQSNVGAGFGVDIGTDWTFLGRVEFTTDSTFTITDSTLFTAIKADFGVFVAPGADLNYISAPPGNITHAGLNTTEIPVGPPAPLIEVSPTSLDFDYVHVDSTKSLPVLVINKGYAPLNVDSVQVPTGFSIDPLNSSGIAVGDTVTFTVTFAPTSEGEFTNSLTFFSNDVATGPVVVNVYGTSIIAQPAPIITVYPTSLNFDSIGVGSDSMLYVWVRNDGDAVLNVDSAKVNTDFSVNPQQDTLGIAPGDSVSFAVSFTPTSAGDIIDTLWFFSNDIVTGTVFVSLHGVGRPTGIDDLPEAVPFSYKLGPNYPNPFNPNTNIPFELKVNGKVTITVYNLLGQKVAEVVNGHFTAGSHIVTFDASGLGTGIYFYRMETNGFMSTRKFVYIR